MLLKKVIPFTFALVSISSSFISNSYAKDKTYPSDISENGRDIIDPIPSEVKKSRKAKHYQVYKYDGKTIPSFTLKNDYDKITQEMKDRDRPWRDFENKNLDITKEEDALKFALLMQEYAYKGMIRNIKNNPDLDFMPHYAKQDKKSGRYWCHMPWLNITSKGREFVHGLTKEFPLHESDAYPFVEKKNGISWGTAFYNSFACESIGDFFGTAISPKTPEQIAAQKKITFQDGYVATKLLFNNSTMAQFDDAYTWVVHGGTNKNMFSTKRRMQKMRHLQMDVAIKDSSILGSDPELNNWLMFTYYYDPTYISPLTKKLNLPEGIRNMRPLGVQYGLSSGKSIIFNGSKNNHCIKEDPTDRKSPCHSLPYKETRLNGPADNPISSCLSCHATSGTQVPASPGIMTDDDYTTTARENTFDFNMQVHLAVDYIRKMLEKKKLSTSTSK
jgi:hypothetical protein